ncbi:MAG: FAD-dependent oxidoreductase [Bacteroidales bacterium]|nr:FAD-dependent oxidoreductase [Bacteroidales bacterium]
MMYDVVIIGSGLGGLQSAYILSREGFNVCLVEKNGQLGGCLQTFKRNGSIFDTGMHYIGSMDEGQVLNRLFKYFGLTSALKLKRLDENGYDIIRFNDKEYRYAMGYESFADVMLSSFPEEKQGILAYVNKLKEVSSSVDLLNLRNFSGHDPGHLNLYSKGFDDFICSITRNETLQQFFFSTSPLYAGEKVLHHFTLQ